MIRVNSWVNEWDTPVALQILAMKILVRFIDLPSVTVANQNRLVQSFNTPTPKPTPTCPGIYRVCFGGLRVKWKILSFTAEVQYIAVLLFELWQVLESVGMRLAWRHASRQSAILAETVLHRSAFVLQAQKGATCAWHVLTPLVCGETNCSVAYFMIRIHTDMQTAKDGY